MKIKFYIIFTIFCILIITSCNSSKRLATKDGLSMENAIKVNSVSEEYQLIKKLCEGCKIEKQALVSNGDKNYDKLDLVKPNGEKVSYYFNIDSFFGKW